jgi:hypothetical protein
MFASGRGLVLAAGAVFCAGRLFGDDCVATRA